MTPSPPPLIDLFSYDLYDAATPSGWDVHSGLTSQPEISVEEKRPMKVQDNSYVAIDYVLSLDSGEVVDRSDPGKPFGFVIGFGQVIPGLERGLQGMEQGRSGTITVAAEDGYGERKDDLYRGIPRAHFPKDIALEAGMVFQMTGSQGNARFRVDSVSDEVIVADFNHPLAGERLHFQVTVQEVREARPEDVHRCRPQGCESCKGDCEA
jgi:FKBP-type peptidyl-prolyl cis-trans isomerase SlyD